ncbi:MAG: hypothetical protein Q8P26_00525 [Candidatus Levybacteria bacterium]|nr:hypothetical protein [Candidatus Levybacteria bacterium]
MSQEAFQNRFPFPKDQDPHFLVDQFRQTCLGIVRDYGEEVPHSRGVLLRGIQNAHGIQAPEDPIMGFNRFVATDEGETEPVKIGIFDLGKGDVIFDSPDSFPQQVLVLTDSKIEMRTRGQNEKVSSTKEESSETVRKLRILLGLLVNTIKKEEDLAQSRLLVFSR